MKTYLFRAASLLIYLSGCLSVFAAREAKPAFDAVTPNRVSVGRQEKFELTFRLTGTGYTNPFDPEQIAVTAVFTSPGKRSVSVDGFCCQEFSRSGPPEKLTAIGSPVWKVRFAPPETGVWSYSLKAVDRKTGIVTLAPQHFTCVSSASRGYVRRSLPNPRYLEYSDGTPYIPIGQNLGWGNWGMENGTFSYDTWLPKIAAQGGNFARYWMWADFHGIEWKDTGLGDYTRRMNEAWRLDHDLDAARANHIQVMLTLLDHGAVSTVVNSRWKENPYNAANGGPCATPRDFFTNPDARTLFRRRLRYIVARWGYASNVMWELANEIDNTDNYLTDPGMRADVAAWHREMAAYLKARDEHRHLVTTSFSRFQNDSAIWEQPDIDLAQFHSYSPSPAMDDMQAAIIDRYRSRLPGKPVFGGEVGFPQGGLYSVANDPTGIQWHNVQWASLLSGAAGSSASWWWADYIEPENLYTNYRGLSRFAAALDWLGADLVPTRPAVTTSHNARADLVLTGYPDWGFKAESNQFSISPNGILSPGEDQLAAFLYSKTDNAERYNPPTFPVTFPAAGEFRLITAHPSGQPRLLVSVDGKIVYQGTPAAGSTVAVPVSAGTHRIALDNTGSGWIDVTNYVFTSLVPALKVYALQGTTTVAAWVANRNFNYANVQKQGIPAPASGTIHFRDLAKNGTWKVEWWDTQTGEVSGRAIVNVTGNRLDLPVPATARDVALRMQFVGAR